jgi:hypothetical protein
LKRLLLASHSRPKPFPFWRENAEIDQGGDVTGAGFEGKEVISSDDAKLGHVIAVRDDCVLVETGHVFKSKHAIPRSFLHEQDGVLRATVSKELVGDSPKVDESNWSCDEVLAHYGLTGTYEVDPDPDALENAETVGARAGAKPAPAQRAAELEDAEEPGYDRPAVRERQANANDPAGVTANLRDKR